MATIYKCDKCGKTIKTDKFNINLSDPYRKLGADLYMSYVFCEKCVKLPYNFFKKFLNKR